MTQVLLHWKGYRESPTQRQDQTLRIAHFRQTSSPSTICAPLLTIGVRDIDHTLFCNVVPDKDLGTREPPCRPAAWRRKGQSRSMKFLTLSNGQLLTREGIRFPGGKAILVDNSTVQRALDSMNMSQTKFNEIRFLLHILYRSSLT